MPIENIGLKSPLYTSYSLGIETRFRAHFLQTLNLKAASTRWKQLPSKVLMTDLQKVCGIVATKKRQSERAHLVHIALLTNFIASSGLSVYLVPDKMTPRKTQGGELSGGD